MSDIDIEQYIHAVRDAAKEFAEKKATLVYMEHWRKGLLARLMKESPATSAVKQEADALSSEAYETYLHGLKVAVEEEELAKWALKRAEMKVELWRTQQATARLERKAYGA